MESNRKPRAFTVSDRDGHYYLYSAEYPERAAYLHARSRFGRRAYALRVTGINGLSGMFQAYYSNHGTLTTVGENFHVTG